VTSVYANASLPTAISSGWTSALGEILGVMALV
jgi:hypothetical protein